MIKFKILILILQYKNFLKKTLYEIFVLNSNKRKRDKCRKKELDCVLKELMLKKPFPLPNTVEIETLNRCNGDYDFCPVNKHLDKREYKVMDDTLYYSIISQLKELEYSGYISAYSNNEPLLDKRIFEFVAHIKKELPNAKNFLFTNGTLLTLDKFLQLIKNLDYMIIDNYYKGKKQLRPKIKEIAQYCLEHPELKNKVKIQHIYRIKSSCLWPFSQMVIRPDGKISLCCNDALGQITMGDLTQEKLIDIWRGENYTTLRNNLLKSRKKVKLCYNCDSFGVNERDNVLAAYNIGKNWSNIEKLI